MTLFHECRFLHTIRDLNAALGDLNALQQVQHEVEHRHSCLHLHRESELFSEVAVYAWCSALLALFSKAERQARPITGHSSQSIWRRPRWFGLIEITPAQIVCINQSLCVGTEGGVCDLHLALVSDAVWVASGRTETRDEASSKRGREAKTAPRGSYGGREGDTEGWCHDPSHLLY